jgi:CheY-like chemotaxis protein
MTPTTERPARSGRRFSVLLVEDEPVDRVLMRSAFEKFAPQVELSEVTNADDARAQLEGDAARDLVLLDLKLPRASGLEILEWIRKNPALKALPVIVLTTSQHSADLERAQELGANSYLVKRVDIGQLRDIIRRIGDYAALISGAGFPTVA